MKKLGIIGGLGPMATAYFFELIVEMTKAETDQQHIEILLHNCPSVPDRTEYILGRSAESPLEKMAEIGKELAKQADVLAIPCITAHYFHQELQEKIGMPLLHGVRETALYLKERKIHRVGVMATDATVEMDIFGQELAQYGIRTVYPDKENQKRTMYLIYENVKAGRPLDGEAFWKIKEHMFANGAEVVLLGCTELSMFKKQGLAGAGILDVMEVLAKCCVEQCGTLKDGWQELIMKE